MKTGMFERMQAVVGRIPRGHVASYGEVARAAGFPGAARQASWALSASHGLPWHRVVAAKGRIVLKGELAMEQQMRLHGEGVTFKNGRVAAGHFYFFGVAAKMAAKKDRPAKPAKARAKKSKTKTRPGGRHRTSKALRSGKHRKA